MISVLIPDGNDTRLLKVVQSLALEKKIKIHVLTQNRKWESFTKYCQFHELNSQNGSKNYRLERILEISKSEEVDILLPIGEEGLSFVIENFEVLKQFFKMPPLASFDSLKTVKDKWHLYNFAINNKIHTPKSRIIEKNQNIDSKFVDFRFPALLKPRIGEGGSGIIEVDNLMMLQNIIQEKGGKIFSRGYILQEYINGKDFDLSAICKNGKILAYTMQQPIYKGEKKYTFGKTIQFIHNEQVLQVSQQIFSALNWSGVVHLDFLYEYSSEKLFLLDFNPRYWGTLLGSTINGINFPFLACKLAQNSEFNLPAYKDIKVAMLNKKEILPWCFRMAHYKNIPLRNTNLKFILKDPFPSLAFQFYKISN